MRPRGTQLALALCRVAFGFLGMQTRNRTGGKHACELVSIDDRAGEHLGKIAENAVIIDKRRIPINGNSGSLFSDSTLDSGEKLILRSYRAVTKNISGCQALRQRIGA